MALGSAEGSCLGPSVLTSADRAPVFLLSLRPFPAQPVGRYGPSHPAVWALRSLENCWCPMSTSQHGHQGWPFLGVVARPGITFDFGGSPEARRSAAPASTSISTQALGMRQMRRCGPAAEARARLLGQSQGWTDRPHLFLRPPCPKSFCTPCSILLQGPAWTSKAPSTVRVKVLLLRHVQSAAMCQQAVGLVLGGISQELSWEPFHTPRIWVSEEQEGWRHSRLPWAMGPAFQDEPAAAPRPPPCQL